MHFNDILLKCGGEKGTRARSRWKRWKRPLCHRQEGKDGERCRRKAQTISKKSDGWGDRSEARALSEETESERNRAVGTAAWGQLPPTGMRKVLQEPRLLEWPGSPSSPFSKWQVASRIFCPLYQPLSAIGNVYIFCTERNYLAADLCYDIYLHGGRGRKTHQWQRNQRNTLSFLIREERCHNRESAWPYRARMQSRHSARQELWVTVTENKSTCNMNSAVTEVIYG